MGFINLTPHAIHIGELTVPPSGGVARCVESTTPVGEHEGVHLVTTTYGEVTDLPVPVEGTIYIVSSLVRSAVPNRRDVASPGALVRDISGQVMGCKNLVLNK